MKLKDAIEAYKQEEGAVSNSYDWYRESAQREGKVSICDTYVPAYKDKNIWCVDDKKFNYAIKQHREAVVKVKQNTIDYANGIIHGKDGEVIRMEGGSYKIHGNFRRVWSNYDRGVGGGYDHWYCNACNIPAKTEHTKEECHRCSDWNGCGGDCTLNKVYCPRCGKSMDI